MEAKKSWLQRLFGFELGLNTNPSPARRKQYRVGVTMLADNMKNERFRIGEEWHAEIVAELMVGRTSKNDELLIYSDSLAPEFYAKILENSKCRIRILFGNTKALGILRALPQGAKDRIDFRASNTPRGKHFLVVGSSVRCEVNNQGDELDACCNFNEPDAAQRLRDRFESMWEEASPWKSVT